MAWRGVTMRTQHGVGPRGEARSTWQLQDTPGTAGPPGRRGPPHAGLAGVRGSLPPLHTHTAQEPALTPQPTGTGSGLDLLGTAVDS